MADQAVADATLLEPEQRGRTDIEGRVLERIATLAAAEVDGVARIGSDLERLIGRRLPKADATRGGNRARVAVEIAVAWPFPLADVAAQVRDIVRSRLAHLTGLDIDAVDVDVARVIHQSAPQRRRVR